uniref:Uncharacterized protein n=1 Tax=Medicago truncatula TaxID=3880 RepID=Q1S5L3_MEDTR|nr:hypothetical protein MtrDRAFT_AC147431g43v2 [Medicago truncatula]
MIGIDMVKVKKEWKKMVAAMFEWQVEMSVPAPIPSSARVATPHVPVASSVVSFA